MIDSNSSKFRLYTIFPWSLGWFNRHIKPNFMKIHDNKIKMKIILYLTFLISGFNCWSISKRHATHENKYLCEENVIERCHMEYHNTKDIEDCKCDGFISQCYRFNLCKHHLIWLFYRDIFPVILPHYYFN